MKKLLSLTLAIILLFSLCACTNGGESEETLAHEDTAPADFTEIRIAVLNGTTGFGIAPLYNDIQNGIDHNMNARIDFYADATLVAPLVIGGSVDIAAVPTNLAATLYNKTGGGIEVLAVNTLGVLYLIENGESVKTLADLAGKTVHLPGRCTAQVVASAAGEAHDFIMQFLRIKRIMHHQHDGQTLFRLCLELLELRMRKPVVPIITGNKADAVDDT